MFILYFALWVVLNGKWTTEIGLFGLAFATVIYLFTWKYMDFGPKMDVALMKRLPAAIRYGVLLVSEIVKANIAVIKMIFKPEFEPKPQLVKFDVDLKKNRHLVALANSITLTPGTITVDLHDNHFLVHALDESLVDGLDDGVFVQNLMALEAQRTGAKAPVQQTTQETVQETTQETVQETQAEPAAQQETAAQGEEDAQ